LKARTRDRAKERTSARGRITAAASALAVAGVLALTGCQGDTAAAGREPQLQDPSETAVPQAGLMPKSVLLRFDDLAPGQPVDEVVNSGELPVSGEVISANGGELVATGSPYGKGVRLPAFEKSDAGFAMIGLFNTGDVYAGTDDPLSPGDGDFAFGADFMLDDDSTGSDIDNGDNLIARGLFEGAAQYKIQVDGGFLSCRVAGLEGDVMVKARERVQPEQWYRARCTRRGDTVQLQVAKIVDRRLTDEAVLEDTGRIGSVEMAQTVPLSVGGKLSGNGEMFPTTTDQFNGRIARVIYRLL
jgi:hypothetical protein